MGSKPLFAGILSAIVIAMPARAIDLSESVDVGSSAADSWAVLDDFCSIANWHPVIVTCEQSKLDGRAIRTLITGDGDVILEGLTTRDEAAMAFTYTIIQSPLPVTDYVATMAVKENDGGARITWSSQFDAKGISEEEALELMIGIYRGGLEELKTQLER